MVRPGEADKLMNRLSLVFLALSALAATAAPAAAQTRAPAKPSAPTVRIAPADAPARKVARIDRAFRAADKNRDNVVTRNEYRDWYREAARRRGPLTWKRHANQLFKQLDTLADGRLTRAEFGADPSFQRVRPGWGGGSLAGATADDAEVTGQ
jgi:hypothetical protein